MADVGQVSNKGRKDGEVGQRNREREKMTLRGEHRVQRMRCAKSGDTGGNRDTRRDKRGDRDGDRDIGVERREDGNGERDGGGEIGRKERGI